MQPTAAQTPPRNQSFSRPARSRPHALLPDDAMPVASAAAVFRRWPTCRLVRPTSAAASFSLTTRNARKIPGRQMERRTKRSGRDGKRLVQTQSVCARDRLEAAHPELKILRSLCQLTDILPSELRPHSIELAISARCPKTIERTMV